MHTSTHAYPFVVVVFTPPSRLSHRLPLEVVMNADACTGGSAGAKSSIDFGVEK